MMFPGAPTLPRYHGLRHWSLTALKFAVTAATLTALCVRVDWPGVGHRLAGVTPGVFVLALVAQAAAMAVVAERWRYALRAAGLAYPRWTLLRIVVAAIFFGQVLPGGIGGDAVRAWLTYRAGEPRGQAVVTAVLLDRVLALAGAVALLVAALPKLMARAPVAFADSIAGVALILAGGLAGLILADRIPLPRRLRLSPIDLLRKQTRLMRAALMTRDGVYSAAAAVLVHIGTIGVAALLARAIGVSLSFGDALSAVPVAILAGALPLSLNGWGMREGAMAAALGLFGVGLGDAVTIAMAQGLVQLLLSLPGGPLWLTLRRDAAAAMIN